MGKSLETARAFRYAASVLLFAEAYEAGLSEFSGRDGPHPSQPMR